LRIKGRPPKGGIVAGRFSRKARAALLVAAFGAGGALAQQDGPAGISVEPFMIYPALDVAVGHDDNLYSSDLNKRSSSLITIAPSVRVEGRPGPHRLNLLLGYTAGRYGDSGDDNYDDYQLAANALAVFSARTDLKLRADYLYGHDPRGSTDRPFGNEPDEYINAGAQGTFGYGAPGARGRLELSGGLYTRQYQNNRIFTEASDRDTGTAGAMFLWRVAPKSQLLAELEGRRIDYDQASSTLDSDETRFYLGARWDATAATSGTAKIGWLKKDFDSPLREDVSTGSWLVSVRWSPLTYSVFDFDTSRQTEESTGVGDTILSSIYNALWTHSWSSRVRSQVLVGWRNDEFRGAAVSREDDIATLGLRLHYQFRRWLRLSAEYTFTDRDSNDPTVVYQRNLILFSVGATL
jgi:polysaccharide biosynthesis protein VpsM